MTIAVATVTRLPMKTYDIKNDGLLQELNAWIEGVIARKLTAKIKISDLDHLWIGGHSEGAPYREPLTDMCKQMGWQHDYFDDCMWVRVSRA